jgi:NitT/TauT family transport system substrate-binding protein
VKLNRRYFLMSLAAAAACNRPKSTLTKLAVSIGPFHTMSPLYVAHERGYFREAGFDLDIRLIREYSEVLPLLIQGVLDLGCFVLTPAICNVVAKGARIRIGAAREYVSTCSGVGVFYGRKDRFPKGFDDPSEWRGKRISTSTRGTITDFSLATLLDSMGLKTGDVQLLHLERAASLAALISGGLDGLMNGFGFSLPLGENATLVAQHDVVPRRLLKNFQYSYILFSEKLAGMDPEIGGAFLAAYLRGSREYMKGATPQYLEQWIEENHMDRNEVLGGCRDSFVLDGSIREDDIASQFAWYLKEGMVERTVTATQIVDRRWLEIAHRHQI